MSSDHREPFADVGLLSPVSVGHDACVGDAAIVDALVTTEIALARALAGVGALDPGAAERLSAEFGWA
ncbi:MAG: hypothetical protein WBX17_02885, partial [Microbacterium sp.]